MVFLFIHVKIKLLYKKLFIILINIMINNINDINDLYLVNLLNINCNELTTTNVNNDEFNQLKGVFTNITIQEQINGLTGDLTGGYNDRLNKIETYVGPLPNSILLQTNLSDIHNKIHDISGNLHDVKIELDTAISDIGVLDATTTAHTIEIIGLKALTTTHSAQIAAIDENLITLNDKTQNISSLLTNEGTTTFENSNLIINNGVSNQVELKKDNKSIFNKGIDVKDDIILTNGKSLISDNINIGNSTNNSNIQLDGTVKIKENIELQNNKSIIGGGNLTIDSGNVSGTLNLGTQFDTININGLLINLNGIVNGTGLTFQQF